MCPVWALFLTNRGKYTCQKDLQPGVLARGQGGHLPTNPLQTKAFVPFYSSSYAHAACPRRESGMETVRGGHHTLGSLVKGVAFQSPRVLLSGCKAPVPLPNTSRPRAGALWCSQWR